MAAESRGEAAFRSASFFVLRSPLLPLSRFLKWAEPAQSAAELQSGSQISPELVRSDEAKLRAVLRSAFADPVLREALYLASPALHEKLADWERQPDSAQGRLIESALCRYYCRLTTHPIPFGLFAGVTLGHIERRTLLALAPAAGCLRKTRLDSAYLERVSRLLEQDPVTAAELRFGVNSSLYHLPHEVRYLESREMGAARGYTLVRVGTSEPLLRALARAQGGATLEQIIEAVCDPEDSRDEAREFVLDLVRAQILESALRPPLTGAGPGSDPQKSFVRSLGSCRSLDAVTAGLSEVYAQLDGLDAAGPGQPPARYEELGTRLRQLLPEVPARGLFQVDLYRPSVSCTLASRTVQEVLRAAEVLWRIGAAPRRGLLDQFRQAFVERYGDEEVPLAEALDEDVGVGLRLRSELGGEDSPLLADLQLGGQASAAPEGPGVSARDTYLARRCNELEVSGACEWRLDEVDLKGLAANSPPPLPDSATASLFLAAAPATAGAPAENLIVLQYLVTRCAHTLARFCHLSDALRENVEATLRAEEALRPGTVSAEIVYADSDRMGNVMQRPILRSYEIPYLGRSGADPDAQLPLGDLFVSVRDGRIVLRSKRLGREVVPRNTTAHAYLRPSCMPVYQFLSHLHTEGAATRLSWDWGHQSLRLFLPRVVCGSVILHPAQWRLTRGMLKDADWDTSHGLFTAVCRLRLRLRLPRFLLIREDDRCLGIDLDNVLTVLLLADELRKRPVVIAQEMLAATDRSVRAEDGEYAHEIMLPLLRTTPRPPAPLSAPDSACRYSLPPGSPWLYAALYGSPQRVDELLREELSRILSVLTEERLITRWFFVRYGDPSFHLRLRLLVRAGRSAAEAFERLSSLLTPAWSSGRIWKLQLDTYQREVERYGGPAAIELAEELFCVDSQASLALLERLARAELLERRWLLALRSSAQLIADLGLAPTERRELLDALRTSFARERGDLTDVRIQLGKKYRLLQKDLAGALDGSPDPGSESGPAHPLSCVEPVLVQRSLGIRRIAADLSRLQAQGQLGKPLRTLAGSFLHMHLNRLLRGSHRAQELVIYDLLYRHYLSRDSRGDQAGPAKRR